MINVDLQQLIGTLDAVTRRALEDTAQRCIERGGSRILVEDLLLTLLECPQGLLHKALLDAGVAIPDFAVTLRPPVESASTRNPVFAPELVQWLQDALLVATLELGQNHIEQAALILALLRHPLKYAGTAYQPLLNQIDVERLRDFARSQQPESTRASGGSQSESMLARFTHDLTRQAREGRIDPVLCRDDALGQMIDILARRRKNNPIVVGEAGVGKSAVVEGLALRIVKGEVPEDLQNVDILSLDLGLVQAGASVKGEFERRLQGVIDEVRGCARPVILFIDEAHTLIGAGGQPGGSDAANLLKPALARGELRTIAATTWSEYRKYFEKDPALARRFQPVRLQEPSICEAVTILRGLAPVYEQGHGVYLRDDAVVAAAQLSARYLSGRQLPDKAADVLDTACARVRISLNAAPPVVEAGRARVAEDTRQLQAMQRDAAAGLPIGRSALDELEGRLEQAAQQLRELEQQWQAQRALATQVLDLRGQRIGADETAHGANDLAQRLADAQTALAQAQQARRLVSIEVCPRLIAEVVSAWTGVPVTQLAREHSANVMNFSRDLRQRLRGQDQAIEALYRSMRAVAAGLEKKDAPVGVFLLVGPSGVGKTETALALADLLYGGERFLTVINMSEFQEKHTVSRLIGAPPGYVGYGEGGMLTEAVRQKPYSVVLLDEVEKADPDVMNLFYQIFDKGVANDGEGREIDFRNTLILMTSNLGSERIEQLCHGEARPSAQMLEERIRPVLSAHFKPALLARMQVVPYFPIADEVLGELLQLKLQRLSDRLHGRGLRFSHSAALVGYLSERCKRSDSGARLAERLLDLHVVPIIADRLLAAMACGERLDRVHATVDATGTVICEFA